jgi:hypothetical protein
MPSGRGTGSAVAVRGRPAAGIEVAFNTSPERVYLSPKEREACPILKA